MTDRGFTGHRHNNLSGGDDVGLVYMNARFYVPGIGRFASADTVVPEPGDPQSLNRFAYALNNPVKYRDPTGHYVVDSQEGEAPSPPLPSGGNGTEITDWLLWQMEWNAQSEKAKQIESFVSDVKMLPDAIEWHSAGLFEFAKMVDYGQPWDFKVEFVERQMSYVSID